MEPLTHLQFVTVRRYCRYCHTIEESSFWNATTKLNSWSIRNILDTIDIVTIMVNYPLLISASKVYLQDQYFTFTFIKKKTTVQIPGQAKAR